MILEVAEEPAVLVVDRVVFYIALPDHVENIGPHFGVILPVLVELIGPQLDDHTIAFHKSPPPVLLSIQGP